MSFQVTAPAPVVVPTPEVLAQAKAIMIYDFPFFASMILGMPFIQDMGIPTATTDGVSIWYNPAFINTLSLPETVFLLAHEVMHAVFLHCTRIGVRDLEKWNVATDLVINDILVKGKIGKFIEGGLLDHAIVTQGGGTAEGVYGVLPQDKQGQKPNDKPGQNPGGSNGPSPSPTTGNKPGQKPPKNPGGGTPGGGYDYPGGGKPLDNLKSPSQDAAEIAQIEAEGKIKITQARGFAKQAGKLSGDLDKLLTGLLASETDWKTVLHKFFTERAKTDWSYAKPKRRFLADDIYLPGMVGNKMGRVAIAVDCSGSVSTDLLKLFSTEVLGLIEDTKPIEVEIIYFDSKILETKVYTQDETPVIKDMGGGGTRFSPIFDHINKSENPPACLVVLTDLVCEDFGPVPSYPVLWASVLKRETPVPFGEITLVKEKLVMGTKK